jgi:hypothetical protein
MAESSAVMGAVSIDAWEMSVGINFVIAPK